MVDISTAMNAARAEKAKSKGNAEKKGGKEKSRAGGGIRMESFDPVNHVRKEKADTFSMWLVLSFGLFVGLVMRYLFLPNLSSDEGFLWLFPLLLILLIQQLHKVVLPAATKEHFSFGTWFKASFLYVFTWLAVSFLLVNPPLGDIASPTLADDWTVVIERDDGTFVALPQENISRGVADWQLEEESSVTNGTLWLVFGVRDNRDVVDTEIELEFISEGGSQNLTDEYRWEAMKQELDNNITKRITPHGEDRGVAIELGQLGIGTHELILSLSEEGDPWTNTKVYEWSLVVGS